MRRKLACAVHTHALPISAPLLQPNELFTRSHAGPATSIVHSQAVFRPIELPARSDAGAKRHARAGRTLAAISAVCMALHGAVSHSDEWDEVPSQTRVMVVAAGQAGFSRAELAVMAGQAAAGLEQVSGGACAAAAAEADPAIALRVSRSVAYGDWSELAARKGSLPKNVEKLVLVALYYEPTGWRIEAQEWDRYAGLGPPAATRVLRRAAIVPTIRQLVADVVQQIAQVMALSPTEAVIRLRGGRILAADAPATIVPGTIFRLCRPETSSRTRQQTGGRGAQVPPEVLLRVTEYSEGTARCSVLRAQPHALFPQGPYYAARVSPRAEGTTLQFVSSDGPPLAGFDVFVQSSEGKEVPLQRTAGDGSVYLPRQLGPAWVELRYAELVIARLPCVPGWQETAVWRLPIGEAQLEALGMLEALEAELEEQVVRHAMLLARGQRALASGNLDEADRLLKELRTLPSAAAFKQRIDQQLRQVSAADPAWQQALRRMFTELSAAADRHLDKSAIDSLADALEKARNPPAATPGAPSGQPATASPTQ